MSNGTGSGQQRKGEDASEHPLAPTLVHLVVDLTVCIMMICHSTTLLVCNSMTNLKINGNLKKFLRP